ncbi:MAG: penicillin-binding protein activator [Candidatus Sedimenticola endophacoides]
MPNKIPTLLLGLLLLSGCIPSNLLKPQGIPDDDPRLEQVTGMEQAGEFATAAALLETISETAPAPSRASLLLRAAENHLKAGDRERAAHLVREIDTRELPAPDFHRRLLLAELNLADNRPDTVLRLLPGPPPVQADPGRVLRYHQIRAESFRLAGNLIESARELEAADLLVGDPAARLDNQLLILQTLSTLSTLSNTALEMLQPSPPGVEGGWMELALIIKSNAHRPEAIQPLLGAWRERFPSHPALPALLDGYFEKLKAQYIRPAHLALMLPMHGPYAKAARAVRDGFMAAYYQDDPGNRPRLHFYDNSNEADTWSLYRQAVDSGADMIIGPLDKASVAQMARAGELEIPVLALNQVPPEVTPPRDLYQFGLSPEDEARQVAEKAWLDGHTRALALTPQGDWGERIYSAFTNRWERLGGLLAEHQGYNPAEHDFKQPIRSLLNIDESYARRRELEQILGARIEFEPRRRADSDFIFLAAQVDKARQIRPQLQLHHAADLPVYTTSHIYSGTESLREDQDLEGLMFPDIPWLLVAEAGDPLSRQNIGEALPDSRTAYRRLYAMGIDSYRLLPHLARLQTSPEEMLDAKTGNLYLDEINQLHRQLVWAQMRGGSPRVLGYAPHMITSPGAPAPQVEQLPSAAEEEGAAQPAGSAH